VYDPRHPHSLRLQLMLWYGGLVAVSLIVFGILVYFWASEAIYQEAEGAVRAETRIAMLNIEQTLIADSHAWGSGLTLRAIDKNTDSSISVEVIDVQGQVLYRSARQFIDILPENSDLIQGTRSGQPQWKNPAIQHIVPKSIAFCSEI